MPRRANGEGSYFKRADGRYGCAIHLDGKRRYIYGKTRADVKAKVDEMKRQFELGVKLQQRKQTVGEYLTHWLDTSVKQNRRPSTYRRAEQIVRLQLIPYIGHHLLSGLTPDAVQKMVNALTASGLAPRTIRNVRAVLRKALNQAMRWGLLARNVATLVELPKADKPQYAILTEVEARQLLDVVRGDRFETLYRLTLSLGLRRGEVLGLRWIDVNFDKRTVSIRQTLTGSGTRRILGTTKSESGVRTLPLPPVLLDSLRAHQARQADEREKAGNTWQENGLVFPNRLGKPYDPRALINRFKAVLRRIGLPQTIRFHDLRHSCATFLIAQGVHLRVVMEMLGHSQIGVTANTYSHVMPDSLRMAADSLEGLFGDSSGTVAPVGDNVAEKVGKRGNLRQRIRDRIRHKKRR